MDKVFNELNEEDNVNATNSSGVEEVVDLEKVFADFEMEEEVEVVEQSKTTEKEVLNVKLGLIVPHREFALDETLDKMKYEFVKETTVEFLAEQFDSQKIKFNIVDVEAISEATATMLDEAISSDYTINTKHYHPTTMSVAIDMGSHSTDFISMLGVDIINGSEKRLNTGVDDLLVEVMNKIEEKYNVPFESLDMENIAASLRYPTIVCKKCGTIVSTTEERCRCGGEFVSKHNIVRIGRRGFDVSEIVDECIEKSSKRILEFFSTYIRRIFNLRGVALNQLENITLSGGGTELVGNSLKEKLENELGEFVYVKKAEKPVRKNVDGLAKLIYFNDKKRDDIDVFVAVDIGCSAAKSKILDKNGNEVVKGIEIPSKIAEPVKMATYKIRKVRPMADLHVNIFCQNGTKGIGMGEYFVGQIASMGEGQTKQSTFIDKKDDRVFYTLAYTSIATLVAKYLYRNKHN